MADFEGERLRRLAIVVKAEREIKLATRLALVSLMAEIAKDYLDEPVVAAARHNEDGRHRINGLWSKMTRQITQKAGDLFAKRFRLASREDSRLMVAIGKFLNGVSEHLKGVPDEIYADLDKIVRHGRDAKLGDKKTQELLAAEITPGHAAYDKRLDVISDRVSRTLAISAFNGGDQDGHVAAAQAAGHKMPTKRWLSSHDTKVRPTHAEADGQVVDLDQDFTVGGFAAQFPGDWRLPPQEAVNCRCTALYSSNGSLVASTSTLGAAVTTPETDITTPDGEPVGGTYDTDGTLPDGWRGPIASLDVPTSDRRMLATPKNGKVKSRAYPLTLTRNHVGDPTGYPTIGSVDNVWMQDGMLYGEGRFDLGGPDGQDAARQLAGGFLNRVSIDPVEVSAENRAYSAAGEPLDLQDGDEMPEGAYAVTTFTDWTLAGLAMVPIPAYTNAAVDPVYGYAPTLNAPDAAIIASVGGQIFSSDFFQNPNLTEPTPLTVTEEGHVYGHVRLSGTCYQYGGGQGNGGFCLEPPTSDCGYAKFMVQGAKMDDGSIKAVGALTFGEGHESRGSLAASQAHYNNVATIAAKGIVGDDEFGVWFSGEVTDNARDKAYDLLLSPMSGHWEPDSDSGHLELMAIHIVVTPGYTVRRIVAGFDEAGQPNSLIITNFPDPFAEVDSEEKLRKYWTEGAGAAKIGWGTDCDFCRCLTEVGAALIKNGKHMSAEELKGFCANLHERATGTHPGGENGGHSDHKKHCPDCDAPAGLNSQEDVVAMTETPSARGAVIAALADIERAKVLAKKIGIDAESRLARANERIALTESIIAASMGGGHIAATSTPWDGPAAAASIFAHATKNGKIDVGIASQGFLAHTGDGSKKGDWKLPFARVVGGVIQIVPRGVSAAAGRLDQTQGIDRAAVKSKISGLYSRIHKMDASWPASPPQ